MPTVRLPVGEVGARYRPYTLAEMPELTAASLRVASFFAGAGGSSTGYRLAGLKPVYANERNPLAAASYRANS